MTALVNYVYNIHDHYTCYVTFSQVVRVFNEELLKVNVCIYKSLVELWYE